MKRAYLAEIWRLQILAKQAVDGRNQEEYEKALRNIELVASDARRV